MPRVLIVQGQMKQYRIPFFVKLHGQLEAEGIQLRVAYSQAPRSEKARGDNSDLPDSFGVKVKGYWSRGERFLYQPLLREIAGADLIIVEHANKHLISHLVLLLRVAGQKRLGFWGLGANKQTQRSRFSEWYKRIAVKWADLYLAYTAGVAREVAVWGVSPDRIISVQNAVDTRELQAHIRSITNSELAAVRAQYGISPTASVGLFCGMLDPVKSVPFLIDCCRIIRERMQRPFHLILVGGGSEQDTVQHIIKDLQWVHAVGPRFGREKATFFKLSDVFLLPGRVGLVILDAFAASLPLITVQIPIHGPEVEYLENAVNGFMVPRNDETYAETVVQVLGDSPLLLRLREGALRSAEKYTVDAMVENFRAGVMRCLSKTIIPKLRHNVGSASPQ
jgi:glycosyltransferase involved in cell wall biosynthesis